ncbi:MAG: alpha/beta hydrolase family protein [Actinomycetota bacterium]|nr:alpha/beta hydrolase [Actinomycetota bacterium]
MNRGLIFEVDGNRLTGGVAKNEEPKAVVVLCHGIPSGMPDEPDDRGYPGLADDIASNGFEVWWFNFRGARDSTGVFTYGGWIDDLHAVIASIRSETDLPIFVVGSSAGGAVALMAASEDPSISAVATLAAPAYWARDEGLDDGLLVHSRRIGLLPPDLPIDEDAWWAEFETNRPEWAVALLGGRPLLVLQGTEDRVVSPAHAQRLYDHAMEPKSMLVLEGAGHQLRRDQRAVDAIVRWVDEWAEIASVRLRERN